MTNKIKWSIDHSHSEISFKVRHLMIANVKGVFKIFDGSIYTVGKDFKTADVDIWIDSSSISTGDDKRDEHLKSADFFDVQNHKQITFTSTTVGDPDAENYYEILGELTIRGITKRVKLLAQLGGIVNDFQGNEKAGFTITGKINRSDWGLSWNTAIEAGGFLVGDEISIMCDVELINESKKESSVELNKKEKKYSEKVNA